MLSTAKTKLFGKVIVEFLFEISAAQKTCTLRVVHMDAIFETFKMLVIPGGQKYLCVVCLMYCIFSFNTSLLKFRLT